ncbi:hypothetical protein G5714_019819 [Onychostoma macrolepis]|uniref:Adhesion G protein-coupled receptor F5-like n=1 Tax=Onychostoma macrolepis TaxID=369639 RepID=A0A7J6BYW1_9TELE|nr:hypothetical protein G5714_019819 [Onychostoma macrolepis]
MAGQVCQPNVSDYQCICEDGYAWSYNNCQTYEACGNISFGSCGCISGFPSDGEMCVLESELPFTDILSEIELESTSISVIDEMRQYLQTITFPLQLDEVVEVLEVDITTVCNFNDSGYKCVCEDQYFWPCDKCKVYGSCDGINNNTCSCINDIPNDRQFCQRVNEITSDNRACAQPVTAHVIGDTFSSLPEPADPVPVTDQALTSVPVGFLIPHQDARGSPARLTDRNNITYKELSERIESAIDTSYSNKLTGYKVGSAKVTGFRPGSVIADYTISATSNSLDFGAANTQLSDSLRAQRIILVKDAFAQSDASSNDICQNEELGVGKTNDVKTGVCGTGMKGTITYKCESNVWKPVEDNCVLEDIDKLTSKVESLLVEEIPVFMANLSIATSENNINITQSAASVQAIVDILSKIANLAQSVVINKPVMEHFLKTVDIIVSDNVTWNKLSTNNTSIKLLSAIEDISDRLTDEFEIFETSIQLKRTTIKNSFTLTSRLPNSTTEIVMPQVPQATIITIIIFTTLDNVLPSQGTNDSRKSDVRINGDVVVVKVNETLNNISFTFDITNQSLGNPQCVFWNFSLNTWDSTGCEVKRNNTGNITCECNHTTSFSILMSPFSIDSNSNYRMALAYITYIGVAISMASLIICLIIEKIVWKSIRRNDTSYMRHVSIVNIAVSLLIANICFIIGAAIADKEQPTSVGRCSPAVFFMHFFYLALFFWMLMSGLLLFYRTVMVLSQMSRAKMMVIAFTVGYGAPLLIAVITVASTAGPQNYISKRNACWLNWSDSMALLAFVIPALTIVAINLVVLIVVLYKMLRRGVGAATQPDEKHALVVIARCVAFLTPIFGLTWGFGIGTMVSRDFGIHVVFALLNSLQVRESLPGKLLLQKLTSSHTNNTSAGISSTSGLPFLRRRNVYNVSEANPSSAFPSSESSSGSYAVIND